MRSEVSVQIEASPELVFALVRDVARWPAILPHYRSVRIERRAAGPGSRILARYVALRRIGPGNVLAVPIVWRSWSWSDEAALEIHFRHAGGATAGMEVTWRIERTSRGCEVSIEHVFRRRLPIPRLGSLLGDEAFPRLVDTFVVRPVAGQTLAAVKALAEALATPESTAAFRAYHRS